MDFTFGVCAIKENSHLHNKIINSIEALKIPNYEIIFVGDVDTNSRKNINLIPFNETVVTGWITKKKNLITKFAKYENVVYFHDYIEFDSDWYDGFLKHGDNFDVCMNRILNLDGKRNVDWLVCYMDLRLPNAEQLLPYDKECSSLMYIPGFYWVAKKSFMEKFPLNENLSWGQAEDIEWSRRVRNETKFSMNSNSTVRFLKQKDYILNEMSSESLEILKKHETYNK